MRLNHEEEREDDFKTSMMQGIDAAKSGDVLMSLLKAVKQISSKEEHLFTAIELFELIKDRAVFLLKIGNGLNQKNMASLENIKTTAEYKLKQLRKAIPTDDPLL